MAKPTFGLAQLKNKENKMVKQESSWSCLDCGATTTDPNHMLIIYFHEDCPKRNKRNK
jgi:hypothetical protein